jgi:Lrp/AsnC family leucine-responsive transcriptional regulator
MPKSDFDPIDCRIIAALQTDARLTNLELADRAGLSPSPCLRRVRQLEQDGTIEGYRAVVGRERIGLGFTAFIGIKINGHADDRADEMQEAIIAMPEVVGFHMISGESDYLLEVVVPDLAHYKRFLLEKLLSNPIIREVRSNIAIQTLKAGAPLPLGHLTP